MKTCQAQKLVDRGITLRLWKPPAGWFKAHCDARDTESMFHLLVADNESRKARGLPTFEPSYALAASILATRTPR